MSDKLNYNLETYNLIIDLWYNYKKYYINQKVLKVFRTFAVINLTPGKTCMLFYNHVNLILLKI